MGKKISGAIGMKRLREVDIASYLPSYRNSSHRSAGCSALTKPQSVSCLPEKCRGYAIWGGAESVVGPLWPNPIWGGNKYVTVRKLNCAAGPRRERECCFYSSLLTDIRGSLPTRLVPLASSKGISNLAHGGADVYWISLFRGNWIKDADTAIPDFDQRRAKPRYWKLEYTKHSPDDRLITSRLLSKFHFGFPHQIYRFCMILSFAKGRVQKKNVKSFELLICTVRIGKQRIDKTLQH